MPGRTSSSRYDGSGKAGGLKVYLDGRPVSSRSRTTRSRARTSPRSRCGSGKRSDLAPLHGDLADLRIYRRTLSPDDVRELADAPMLALAGMPADERSKAPGGAGSIATIKDHVDVAWRQAATELAKLRKQKTDLEGSLPDRDGDGRPADAAADLRPEARPVRHARHQPEG